MCHDFSEWHLSSHVPFIHGKYLFEAVYSLMGNRIRRIFNTDARERRIFECFACSWTYLTDFVTWDYHEPAGPIFRGAGRSQKKKNNKLKKKKIIKKFACCWNSKLFCRSLLGDAKNRMRDYFFSLRALYGLTILINLRNLTKFH